MFSIALLLLFLLLIFSSNSDAKTRGSKRRGKLSIVGNGNWATAIARLVGNNVKLGAFGNLDVSMWVFEELYEGRNLSDIINENHENPKYLPNVKLPTCIHATTNLVECCKGADVILFCIPHQYLPSIIEKLKGIVKPSVTAISLIKGLSIGPSGPVLLTDMIKKELGLKHVAVLMGANVAADVSRDEFVEATFASIDLNEVEHLAKLFECKTFKVQLCDDIISTEICGALKNVVAMGAGYCDGLNLGASTKAAIIRKGLTEMADFCRMFSKKFELSIMLQSCGVADVIASSFGGRNRECSAEFVRQIDRGIFPSWNEIESSILAGQKMQGLNTCDEVIACLNTLQVEPTKFRLFRKIHAIARLGADPKSLFSDW